jgi:DUF4097 and DUF4098 domain-containing protein YvlB
MRYERITKAWMITALVALGAGVLSLSALAKDRYEEKFEKTEALARDGKVFLGNVSGDVAVKTWDKAEVRIEALKVSEASSEAKAKENIGQVTIEITRESGVLRIDTKYPQRKTFWGGDSVSVSVDYKLWVPAGASVEVKSISGDVDLEALGGAVKARVISGSVTLRKAAAGADLTTVSGDLTIEDVAGNVYLKTVSGDIDIIRIKGSIEAESVSGGIKMREVSGAAGINAKTLSGDVDFQGKLEAKGRYDLKSHSGNVGMVLPGDSAFSFDAETFSGVIDSDFKIEVSGKISPREVHGTINGGGAEVQLSTFSGSVDLKKGPNKAAAALAATSVVVMAQHSK